VVPIENNVKRVCDTVVPKVNPDMVAYSAYEVTSYDMNALKDVPARLSAALKTIDQYAPDPLHLGSARIVISEFGLYENVVPQIDIAARTRWVLETTRASGLRLAFLWQLYDNECKDKANQPLSIALKHGDISYPANNQCVGLWLVRPDGTDALALPMLKSYWGDLTGK